MKFSLKTVVLVLCLWQTVQSYDLKLSLLKKDVYKNLEIKGLSELRDIFSIDTFVETGTFRGNSTIRAAEVFEKVYTIELRKEFYDIAWKNLELLDNVQCILGDSSSVLQDVLQNIGTKRVLFWLDGHDDAYTPILEELEAIKDSNCRNEVFLIDDMQSFNSLDYPSINTLVEKIKSIDSSYNIVVFGDILLAYPNNELMINISSILESCTASRLYDAGLQSDGIKDLVVKELHIGKADGVELETIDALAMTIRHDSHYLLWQALIKYQNNEFREAIDYLDRIIYRKNLLYKNQRTINHWRVWFYKALVAEKLGDKALLNDSIQAIERSYSQFSYEEFRDSII